MRVGSWRSILLARLGLRATLVLASAGPLALARQDTPATPENPPERPQQRPRPRRDELKFGEQPGIEEFKLRSPLLSEFWGRDVEILAGVVEPLDLKPGEKLPVAYNVHGFGGCHRIALMQGAQIQKGIEAGSTPRMLYVFLHGMCPRGHHEFADSANNGPWGRALTQEFIPALEKKCGGVGEPWARFVTGHSSGGWSSLWLQVAYPDFFGGCWSTAPDPVDFRDFTGIDVYSFKNAFTAPDGQPIMLMRRNGKFVNSIQQFVNAERQREPVGGQFWSFNAVFSEKGPDGLPKQLFDWQSGAIDAAVAESWRPYDISLVLRENWKTLGPKLAGKVHVWMGTIDTFRLEGATI